MTSAEFIDRIVEQMPLQEALESFVAACNRRDTLFITERWFAPRKKKLLALLSDPNHGRPRFFRSPAKLAPSGSPMLIGGSPAVGVYFSKQSLRKASPLESLRLGVPQKNLSLGGWRLHSILLGSPLAYRYGSHRSW